MAIISRWKLNGNASDSVSGLNGIASNITYKNSSYGTAAYFNGTNSTISIANNSLLQLTSNQTHEMVVSIDVQPSAGTQYRFYDDNGGASPYGMYLSYVNNSGVFYVGSGYNTTGTTSIQALTNNNDYHITFTHNDSSDEDIIYINGNILTKQSGKTLNPIAKSTIKYIGCEQGIVKFMKGKMSNVSIYNNVLSPGTVKNRFSFLRGYI